VQREHRIQPVTRPTFVHATVAGGVSEQVLPPVVAAAPSSSAGGWLGEAVQGCCLLAAGPLFLIALGWAIAHALS